MVINQIESGNTVVTTVLTDIIDLLYVKRNNLFDILIIGHDQNLILSDLMTSSNQSFSYELKVVPNIEDLKVVAFQEQALIILPSLEELSILNRLHKLRIYHSKQLKFVIYIEELRDNNEIKSLYDEGINMFSRSIDLYEYFVVDDGKTISFATVQWHSNYLCNVPFIKTLNQFNKKSMKWKKELRYDEKFMNFEGCSLAMMLPIDSHVWNFAALNQKLKQFEACGIAPSVFHALADKFNYVDEYQPAQIISNERFFVTESMKLINNNGTYKIPEVYFDVYQLVDYSVYLHTTSTFIEKRVKFLLTPGEPYTIYEKLMLPFDHATWIGLLITFGIAFGTVFIINTYTLKVQELLYGRGITTPTLNIISTFFGIAQHKIPQLNFSRILLINFTCFCLIIRTCYQSKLFEFMTTLMRRPHPQTLEDLFLRNYTIYYFQKSDYYKHLIGDENWSSYKQLSYADYDGIFVNQSQNGSFKASLLMFDVYQHFEESLANRRLFWLELKDQNLYVVQLGLTHFANVFFSAALQKAVQAFTDTGIIQYLFERNYHIKRNYQPVKDCPNVLTFNDLSFGFYIWFGACCVSIIAFLIELLWRIQDKRRILVRQNSVKRTNHQKVHPAPYDMQHQQVQSRHAKAETLKKFRVLTTDSISRAKTYDPKHDKLSIRSTRSLNKIYSFPVPQVTIAYSQTLTNNPRNDFLQIISMD